MTTTASYIPVFTSLYSIKEVNGISLNHTDYVTYSMVLDCIMMHGEGKAVAFKYSFLANRLGVSVKTVMHAVHALRDAGMIKTSKGHKSLITYQIGLLPYQVPGLSEEDQKGIKEDWNDLYI